jgi:hypothetical protein
VGIDITEEAAVIRASDRGNKGKVSIEEQKHGNA